ncbi:zinc knuckle CX2CX4HX4C containing protein [Tanacetum coccineum]
MVGWRWWCDEVMVVRRCGGGASEVMDGGDDIVVVDVVVVAWWCCRGRCWCGEGRRQWPNVGRKKVTMVETVDRDRSRPVERGCGRLWWLADGGVRFLVSDFQPRFIMDNPNITMEEYIILQEEKAQIHGRTFNWQTATYGKMEYCEDEDDSFTSLETEYPAIVFDDTSDASLSCEPTVLFVFFYSASMDQRRVVCDGEALHRDVAHRMKMLTGKDSSSCGSIPRMATKDVSNPKSVLQSLSGSDSSIQARTTHPKSNTISDVNVGDFITELFDISLANPKHIDTFTSDLESGKYRVWSELTRDKCQEVMNTIWSIWNKLVAKKTDASVSGLQSILHKDINVSKFLVCHSKPWWTLTISLGILKRVGLQAVLESGPWMIRNTPIILKKWSMSTSLLKEELTRIPIWVKLHGIPLQVFEEDGRSSFARCLIKVNPEDDLMDVVTMGIHSLTGDDFTKETIRDEYEWRPPRCDKCKIFGHVHDHCPKKVVSPPIVTTSNVAAPTVKKSNDGFQTMGKNEKRKGKSKSTNGGEFASPSVKQTVRYEPKAIPSAPKKGATNVSNPSKSPSMLKIAETSLKKVNFTTSKSFSALNDEEEDDEEVENVYDE